MRVTTSLPQIIQAGDTLQIKLKLTPPSHEITLLTGYALVQGSFKLGDLLLSEPFQETRKSGVVLTKRGLEYGQSDQSNSLFTGVLYGIKNLVHTPQKPQKPPSLNFEEVEYPIFSTAQQLIFTNLSLNQEKSFDLEVDLPANLPPSYKSRSLQINYQVVVGIELLDNELKRPIEKRIFTNFKLLPKPLTPQNPDPLLFDLFQPVTSSPPRLQQTEQFEMDKFVNDLLTGNSKHRRRSSTMNLTGSQYTRTTYDITRKGELIAKLTFAKPFIHIGDVLAAQLSFNKQCMHTSVFLEMEEHISPEVSAHSQTSSIVYAKQHQNTLGLQTLPIYLPTLMNVAPRVDTVQLKAVWALRLEIVCLQNSAFEDGEELVAKRQVDADCFSCRIPVYVVGGERGEMRVERSEMLRV